MADIICQALYRGAGKTSLLRAVAGLWEQGEGEIQWAATPATMAAAAAAASALEVAATEEAEAAGKLNGKEKELNGKEKAPAQSSAADGLYFIPQRPYLVLGTLRQQLLYPTWIAKSPAGAASAAGVSSGESGSQLSGDAAEPLNGDSAVAQSGDDAWSCGVEGCAPIPSDAELEAALHQAGGLLRTTSRPTVPKARRG